MINLKMMKLTKEKILEILILVIVLSGMFLASTVSVGAVSIYVDGEHITSAYMGMSKEAVDQKVEEVLLENGFSEDDVRANTDVSTNYVTSDQVVSYSTKKEVPVEIDGDVKVIETYVDTVGQLKAEYQLENIEANYPEDAALSTIVASGNNVVLDSKTVTRTVDTAIAYESVRVEDETLEVGTETVTTPGVNGVSTTTYTDLYINGELDSTKTGATTTVDPVNEVVSVGTKEPVVEEVVEETTTVVAETTTTETTTTSTSWDSIAACESGNNWSINTGNGYYGGLQIAKPTWDSFAPAAGVTAEYPHQASKAEQILVAEQILLVQGYGAWGNCA